MHTRIILAILALGAGFFFFFHGAPTYEESATIGKDAATFKILQERFETLADDKGAIYAFEVLRRAPLPPNTDLHLLAHTVGDKLYEQQGVEGMAVCTQEFRNACSHAVVVGTLQEFGGEAALPLIRDACRKAPGGPGAYTMCYHGLGHGVLAFYGFEFTPTVELCKKTGTPEFQNGEAIECMGGAVMELMGGGDHDKDLWQKARDTYLSSQQPLMPCTSTIVPEEAKGVCLIYLTPRLFELAGADLGLPDPSVFPKAFSFCEMLPKENTSLREACFGGFGKEFIVIAGARDVRRVDQLDDASYARAGDWCMLAGVEDGRNACIKEAVASVFWGGENDPSASFRYCAIVHADVQKACYEHLAGSIAHYFRGGEKDKWCGRIPEPFRALCKVNT